MPEIKALQLLAAVVLVAVAAGRLRAMPFLVLVLATAAFGVAGGGDVRWTAREFGAGFGQTIAAAGLAVLVGAMVARLAEASGAVAYWRGRLGNTATWIVTVVAGLLAGIGGTPVGALAVLTPVLGLAGAARRRLALATTFAVNAAHGCLLPAPLPIAALTILDGDWRWGLLFGVLVAAVQLGVGLIVARRAPDLPPVQQDGPPSARAGVGLVVATLVLIGLVIGQALGQIPSEPFGGGNVRQNLLGLGLPMMLMLGGLGLAAAIMGGFGRKTWAEDGWIAQGATAAMGVFLAVGAAGGFQLVLHNTGMAALLGERVLELPAAFGVAIPFLVALVSRVLQGSALTATITAAGMMQPFLVPLGLDGDAGRALAAVAVGAGSMAAPHVNDGYFWLSAHLAGLRAHQGLAWITGGALAQGLAAVATLALLAQFWR